MVEDTKADVLVNSPNLVGGIGPESTIEYYRQLQKLTMKKLLSLLFLLFLSASFFFPTLAFTDTRGIRVTAKQGQSLYLYMDYHALVVGVSNYEIWPKLPYAVKDAKEVASKLKDMGFKVRLIIDPTSQEMRTALNEMVYKTGLEVNRGLLFYYAGHGETETLADNTKMGYIIPKDSPLLKKDPLGFAAQAISMREIESISLRIKSKHVLMLFDSCFSGSLFGLVRAVPDDITEKSSFPVRQYITAGGEDEQVPDKSMFKRSFLIGLEGDADLTGDGYITGTELGMYLSDKVVNYTQRRQHPQYGKINNPDLDRGDFIFVPKKKYEAGLKVTEEKLQKAKLEKKVFEGETKGQSQEISQAAAGAVTAEVGFPPIGTKYTLRISTENRSYIRTFTVVDDGIFENKQVHRRLIEGKDKINLYDKVSKNWIGQIMNGEVVMRAKPHEDLFRFPLYVGKKYESKYVFSEKDRTKNIIRSIEVKSLEKVTVPAGTLEAFKIIVKRKGVKKIYWYSPKLKIFVKIWEKHRRKGESTRELIEYNAP
jgi:hypothetical protein